MSMDIGQFRMDISRDEGCSLKPYKDTVGKTTIAYGRNLDDVGITQDEATHLLNGDINRVQMELDRALPWWTTLPDGPARVLCNMVFNMGLSKVLQFKTTLGHLQAHEFKDAAASLRDSLVYRQLPVRYERLAQLLETS
jgi:lysozyme